MSGLAWLTAKREIGQRLRDPFGVLIWLVVPLAIAGILSAVFGGDEGLSIESRLFVADHDESFASGLLTSALGQGPLGELFLQEPVDEETGRRRMDDGEGSALLVIPEGFGNAAFQNEPVRLTLVVNPSERILPKIAEEALETVAELHFYLQLLVGDRIRELELEFPDEGVLPNADVASISVTINDFVRRLTRYLDPPLIGLASDVPEAEAQGRINLGALFFPGAFFMAMLFMGQGLSGDIWTERDQGTLRRLAVSPAAIGGLLLGRMIAFAVLLAIIGLIMLPAAVALLGLEAANLPLALLWATAAGIVFYLLMTLAQLYAGSARTGGLLTGVAVFPLVMIGGAFFPFEAMPAAMASIGRLTPNGWALVVFKSILKDEAEVATVLIGFVAMALLAWLLLAIAARRLRKAFIQ